MHQRTWLSLLTLPVVVGLTVPLVPLARSQAPRIDTAPAKQDPLTGLADIQDVLSLIRDNYVDPVDMEKVLSGGVQAALERANPLNSYLSPEDLRLTDPGPADPGLQVVKRGLYAQVLAVKPGSPAAKAGVIAGDVLRKIDGQSVGAMTQWTLERRIRGAAGSKVKLLRYAIATGETRTLELERVVMPAPALQIRKEARGTVVSFFDLQPGRAKEFQGLLADADPKKPVLLDLRQCVGGTLDEARQVASVLGFTGTFASVQETGQKDREVRLEQAGDPLPMKVAALSGAGCSGAGELLLAAMKKAKLATFGDRTAALGIQRTRVALKFGGAVDLVTVRWVGAGGEKLDRQAVVPEQPLRGLRPDEDPVPRVLDLLEDPKKVTQVQAPRWKQPRPEEAPEALWG